MLRLVAALGVILLLAVPAHAQTGSVSGTVVDETGAVVPGATVVLVGAGGRQTTITGPQGEYSFGNLASGTYDIIVSLVGFGQASRTGVVVGSSAVQVPPIELAVARLGETVVVSAARVETALVDAPATMSVIGTRGADHDAGAELRGSAADGPWRQRRAALRPRRERDEPAGDLDAHQLAAGAARRPFHLPRLLRHRPLGLPAEQPERHQTDRSDPRPGLRRLGRECADRGRQHHHEVAAGSAGHRRVVERRILQSRRRLDRRQGRRAGCSAPMRRCRAF